MNVCLIGSNGSLASAVGRYCNKHGLALRVIGRSVPKRYQYDEFRQIDLMNESVDMSMLEGADIVIYAAGAGVQSYLNEGVANIYHLNVFVPIALHQMLSHSETASKTTLITFGSYFEIGENTTEHPFTEEEIASSLRPVPNDYCISKRMLTRYISSVVRNKGRFLHFVLPTVYGENENENENRLIPYILRSIKHGEKMSFTSGSQVRQYLYIDEVPAIIEKAVRQHIPNGIYNIDGNELLSVKELVCMLLEAHNIKPDEGMFGATQRQDVGMKHLQMDGAKLHSVIDHDYKQTILTTLGNYMNIKQANLLGGVI